MMRRYCLSILLLLATLVANASPAFATTTATNNITVYTLHNTPPTLWWLGVPFVSNYSVKISTTTSNTYSKTFNGVSQFTLEKIANGPATLEFYGDVCKRVSWVKGNGVTHENRNQLNGGYLKIADTARTPWIIVDFVNICTEQDESTK